MWKLVVGTLTTALLVAVAGLVWMSVVTDMGTDSGPTDMRFRR